MSSILIARAGRYIGDARRALERAPSEVAIALLLAATFSYTIEADDAALRVWFEIGAVALLAGFAAWASTLLHALGTWSARARWSVTLAVTLLATAYGAFVMDFTLAAEAWRATMLVAAAALLAFAAPSLAWVGGSRSDSLRLVNGRIALRVVGVVIYALALYAGLALALSAVNVLFELDLSGHIYIHVFGWIFLALVPWVIAGGLPDYVHAATTDDRVAGAVHRMSGFLVPPLLAVYLAILVAYVIRIAVTGTVPKNLVSPMVLAAGALTIAALLLFDPRPAQRSALRWLRGVPFVLLPLGGLGVWSVGVRLAQYGVTELRGVRVALLAALMMLAAGAAYDVVRRRSFPLHAAPLLLATVLLLSAIGPWSVLAVAERSQQARLSRALHAAGVTAAATPTAETPTAETPTAETPTAETPTAETPTADTPTAETPAAGEMRLVPAAVYDEIRTTAYYLRTHFGERALPAGFAHLLAGDAARADFAAAVGLARGAGRAPGDRGDPGEEYAHARLADGVQATDGAAGSFYRVTLTSAELAGRRGDAGYSALQDGMLLRIRFDEIVLSADLQPLAVALRSAPGRGGTLDPADALLVVHDAAGAARGSLLLLDVHARWVDDVFHLLNLDAVVMLGER